MVDTFVTIKDGRVLEKIKVKDGRYHCRIDRKNKRSVNQNAYIHAVLFPELAKAFNSVGYECNTDQAKSFAKKQFLTRHIVNKETGEYKEYIEDTHNLSKLEMVEFIDRVIQFAAENMNYGIRYPNEIANHNGI